MHTFCGCKSTGSLNCLIDDREGIEGFKVFIRNHRNLKVPSPCIFRVKYHNYRGYFKGSVTALYTLEPTTGFVPFTSRYKSMCSRVGKGLLSMRLSSLVCSNCISWLVYSAMDHAKQRCTNKLGKTMMATTRQPNL